MPPTEFFENWSSYSNHRYLVCPLFPQLFCRPPPLRSTPTTSPIPLDMTSGTEGTRTVTLVIESISPDQEGWYRHQATDSRGSATKDVYIKVIPGTS